VPQQWYQQDQTAVRAALERGERPDMAITWGCGRQEGRTATGSAFWMPEVGHVCRTSMWMVLAHPIWSALSR